jgi:hypothetical protein
MRSVDFLEAKRPGVKCPVSWKRCYICKELKNVYLMN